MRSLIGAVAFAFVGCAVMIAPAHAQVVRGNQIVAQANFVDRNQRDAPQVSLVVRADYVLFSVVLETGTRSADTRKQELSSSFRTFTNRAERAEGVTVEVGRPGYSAALETATADEIIQNRGQDRSGIDLVLKVAVRERETFDQLRDRAEKFVRDTSLNGRVEAIVGDSQFLEVANPAKHRAALIEAIAADLKQMQSTFGASGSPATVSLTGLENRVLSRPVGPLDLEIYIPYSMSLVAGPAD
ncbi:MAG: hypothetical protein R3C52_07705 [Hyphomonadaceae bacterium]